MPLCSWEEKDTVTCPYNISHQITASRLQHHLVKCRKNYPESDIVVCPFNSCHHVPRSELQEHRATCSDRKFVERGHYSKEEKVERTFIVQHKRGVRKGQEEDEDWEKEATVKTSYNPRVQSSKHAVLRKLEGATPSQRKEFRAHERSRLGMLEQKAMQETGHAVSGRSKGRVMGGVLGEKCGVVGREKVEVKETEINGNLEKPVGKGRASRIINRNPQISKAEEFQAGADQAKNDLVKKIKKFERSEIVRTTVEIVGTPDKLPPIERNTEKSIKPSCSQSTNVNKNIMNEGESFNPPEAVRGKGRGSRFQKYYNTGSTSITEHIGKTQGFSHRLDFSRPGRSPVPSASDCVMPWAPSGREDWCGSEVGSVSSFKTATTVEMSREEEEVVDSSCNAGAPVKSVSNCGQYGKGLIAEKERKKESVAIRMSRELQESQSKKNKKVECLVASLIEDGLVERINSMDI